MSAYVSGLASVGRLTGFDSVVDGNIVLEDETVDNVLFKGRTIFKGTVVLNNCQLYNALPTDPYHCTFSYEGADVTLNDCTMGWDGDNGVDAEFDPDFITRAGIGQYGAKWSAYRSRFTMLPTMLRPQTGTVIEECAVGNNVANRTGAHVDGLSIWGMVDGVEVRRCHVNVFENTVLSPVDFATGPAVWIHDHPPSGHPTGYVRNVLITDCYLNTTGYYTSHTNHRPELGGTGIEAITFANCVFGLDATRPGHISSDWYPRLGPVDLIDCVYTDGEPVTGLADREVAE